MVKPEYHRLEQNDAANDQPGFQELHREQRRRRLWTAAAIGQFAILVGLCLFFLGAKTWPYQSNLTSPGTRGGFPAAEASLRFRKQLFDKYGVMNSPTAQDPGPGLDQAWHDLLSSMMIRVTPQELQSQTSELSIPLADGSGDYVASLGVYHELHCTKLLKHWLHKDHYLAGWDEDRVYQYWKHLNHCIDWIKTAALCRSDTTLTTLAWNGSRLDTEYPVEYTCVQPESLFEWADQRAVDVSEPGILRGPE